VADALPGILVVPTRAQLVASFLRDWKVRSPLADVGPGSQPAQEAAVAADQDVLGYADAQVISNGTQLETSSGAWLEAKAREVLGLAETVNPRLPAAGGSGFVTITASTGGGTIFAGDEIRDNKTSLRYRCLTTALYVSGSQVPVLGFDTGPATNLKAGAAMTWTSPRPGIGSSATVTEQSDGSGLTGGRNEEDDAGLIGRIKNLRANPPASGNDAAYQKAIEETSGISIQKAFTYPAINGPGTSAFAFTLNPSVSGGSKVPNGAQVAQVLANLIASFPADDGIFGCSLIAVPTTIGLRVTWAKSAIGWLDAVPWPAFILPHVAVDGGAAVNATSFRLSTTVDTTTPVVGQTIGFYSSATADFRRKKILTVAVVTANRKWDITVDTSNNASDATYIPEVGDAASPWSDSLNTVVPAITAYFDGLGPGEQVSSLPDPGARQKRQPESPAAYPSVISNRLLNDVFDITTVFDATVVEPSSLPQATAVGVAGVSSNILQLGDIVITKQ
jgi:uncharacterized phage protein gp47/JayE